jgi:hypothetical protein
MHAYSFKNNDRSAIQGAQITLALLFIVETLLIVRFILKLSGADQGDFVVSVIYNITSPLSDPFLALFSLGPFSPGFVFEWSTLVAMLVYWFLASSFAQMFLDQRRVPRNESIWNY